MHGLNEMQVYPYKYMQCISFENKCGCGDDMSVV